MELVAGGRGQGAGSREKELFPLPMTNDQ